MRMILILLAFSCPAVAQIGDIGGLGDPGLQQCYDRCDQDLRLRQDIAENNLNLTVNACVAGNIGTCVGCLFLTAPPAVIACWVACGIVVPTTCAGVINEAWDRYVNQLVQAGNRWADCLERCELNCT